MTNQQKFETAEDFLNDWWCRVDEWGFSNNKSKAAPENVRDKFIAVPCECNVDGCCGWTLKFKWDSIQPRGLSAV